MEHRWIPVSPKREIFMYYNVLSRISHTHTHTHMYVCIYIYIYIYIYIHTYINIKSSKFRMLGFQISLATGTLSVCDYVRGNSVCVLVCVCKFSYRQSIYTFSYSQSINLHVCVCDCVCVCVCVCDKHTHTHTSTIAEIAQWEGASLWRAVPPCFLWHANAARNSQKSEIYIYNIYMRQKYTYVCIHTHTNTHFRFLFCLDTGLLPRGWNLSS